MTSKLVVNTIEADTGISSVSFGSSISLSSTSKFFFGAAGIDIGADTNINRPAAGVLGFNINSSEKARITSDGDMGLGTNSPNSYSNQRVFTINGTNYGRLDLEVGGTLKGSVWADSGGLALDAGGNEIEFYAGSAERLRITSTGNLSIASSDITKTWSLGKAIHIGNAENCIWGESGDGVHMVQNAYYNSGYKKVSNDRSSLYTQYQGIHAWSTAAAASADSAVSFTESLRITTAGQLVMGATTSKAKFEIKDNGYTSTSALQRISADDDNPYALIIANDTLNTGTVSGLQFYVGNTGTHTIRARGSSTASNNNLKLVAQNDVIFNSGSSETERLRIHSDGKMSLGTSSSASSKFNISHGNELALYTSGPYNYQAKFESTDAEAAIVIEDVNSGSNYNRIGVITNDMTFITNNNERLRINSNGAFGLGGANYGSSGQVLTSQGSGSAVQWASVSAGGQVRQTIQATKSDTASYTVTSGGITPNVLEVNITLSSNTSKVMIYAHACVNDYAQVFMVLTRNGSTIALGDGAGNRMRVTSGSNLWDTTSLDSVDAVFLDDPYGGSGSVSQLTYSFKLRCRDNNTSTIYLNRTEQDNNNSYQARGFTNIIVQEIAA